MFSCIYINYSLPFLGYNRLTIQPVTEIYDVAIEHINIYNIEMIIH